MAEPEVCVVVGAGDATGGAVARRFAREGLVACPVRRSGDEASALAEAIRAQGGQAVGFGCDARVEEQVVDLFARIEAEIGAISITVFNIGANVRFPFLELETMKFRKIWELACLAGFHTCREAARHMVPRGRGTILVTGASASVKGYAGGAAFGSAKFALRGMTQSLAREFWPRGIHVAHVVIDGVIDTAFIRETFPEMYAKKEQAGILDPEHIAQTYWQLYCQPRDAWTQELDLRPWCESY